MARNMVEGATAVARFDVWQGERRIEGKAPGRERKAPPLTAYCGGALREDGVVRGVFCGAVPGSVIWRSFVTSSAGGPPMPMSGIFSTFASGSVVGASPYAPPPNKLSPPAANPTLGPASRNETANAASSLLRSMVTPPEFPMCAALRRRSIHATVDKEKAPPGEGGAREINTRNGASMRPVTRIAAWQRKSPPVRAGPEFGGLSARTVERHHAPVGAGGQSVPS